MANLAGNIVQALARFGIYFLATFIALEKFALLLTFIEAFAMMLRLPYPKGMRYRALGPQSLNNMKF